MDIRIRKDSKDSVIVRFLPRDDDSIHSRRRYMLLGQTLDSIRVWDIIQTIRAIRTMPDFKESRLTLEAEGDMGVDALYASLFEPVDGLDLRGIPSSHMKGPDYINILKIMDIPEAVALAATRCPVRLQSSDSKGWDFLTDMAKSPVVKLDLAFTP